MSITGIMSGILQAIGVGSKKHLSSFSFLETTDGKHTIVGKDGSMMTLLRIDGVKKVIGQGELNSIIDRMNVQMAPYLAEEGHAIQVWFARDPDLSGEMIREALQAPRGIAQRLPLDLDDVFEERQRTLPKWVVWEGFYIALWTRMSIMTKKERDIAKRSIKTPKALPGLADAQNPFRRGAALRDRHNAFVRSFGADLKEIEIRFEVLEAREALRAVKSSIYPDLTGTEWRPSLMGTKLNERVPEIGNYDMSHLLWPRIDDQLFDREAEIINPRITKVGSKFFAAMDMTVGPQETFSFSYLMQRMMDLNEFPWRISFMIEGAGLKSMNIKRILASIFQFSNSDNQMIHEAIKSMEEERKKGTTIAKVRISFATWSDAGFDGDLRLIEERARKLQRAAESWGYCGVTPLVGDPVAGVFSSALGLDVASTAPAGAVPMPDVIGMLPWNRDASPWLTGGATLFRTPDGRLWPYQPGSVLQNTYIDLCFAPPGCGKSVWLSTTNLGMTLSALATAGSGGIQLPRIAIIDIGPSSSGFISLLREALPAARRHEAAYYRMKMSPDFAINVFDTQLGARRPNTNERAFLVNFLTELCTDPGREAPSGLANMMGAIVDTAYASLDDNVAKGVPNIYNPGVNSTVDRAIKQYNLSVQAGVTTWWDIVDSFFAKDDVHMSTIAQRYAVPRLDNLMKILRDPQVMNVHNTAVTETGERLADAVARLIASAIKEFPIFQEPTAFDIGDSRIVALDLMDVAPSGGPTAEKQTALMYMLARYVLAKDFYLEQDFLSDIPPEYHAYHEPRIRRLKEMPKRIVFDEFHRTEKAVAIREQVMRDMREGRKYNVHICLASQRLEDFDPAMVDLATGVWIMGVGPRAADEATRIFNLSPTSNYILKNNLGAPGKHGAPMLAVLSLKGERHEHLLYNTLGGVELWAFSTTAEDVAVRDRLYQIIGPKKARLELSKRYPGGSAKDEIDRRKRVSLERGHFKDEEEAMRGVIEQMVRELAGDSYRQ